MHLDGNKITGTMPVSYSALTALEDLEPRIESSI
jgi:hypothetical protein